MGKCPKGISIYIAQEYNDELNDIVFTLYHGESRICSNLSAFVLQKYAIDEFALDDGKKKTS